MYGAKLQGFLFFATAYKLLEEIKARHESGKKEGRPLTYILLDFQSVVGVDGSAISVFEKLRRFAAREGIELVLADVDRPELSRVVNITLYGEDRPTFAFVDRVAKGIRMNLTGDILASDQSGRVIQVTTESLKILTHYRVLYRCTNHDFVPDSLSYCTGTPIIQVLDLDTAIKFAEDKMIAAAARAAGRRTGRAGSADPCDAAGGSAGDAPRTFDDMVVGVCATAAEERIFRSAWRPVEFHRGQVVCARGEVADRIYFIEDAVIKVGMARGEMKELTTTAAAEASSLLDLSEIGQVATGMGGDGDPSDVTPGVAAAAATGLGDAIGGILEAGARVTEPATAAVAEAVAEAVAAAESSLLSLLDSSAASMDDVDGLVRNDNEDRQFSMSVTYDFMGAVGFYRRGGVGKVRFAHLVVEQSGSGYVLRESDVASLELTHPLLAMKLHRMMAGHLADQVISRNKLITQYVR